MPSLELKWDITVRFYSQNFSKSEIKRSAPLTCHLNESSSTSQLGWEISESGNVGEILNDWSPNFP